MVAESRGQTAEVGEAGPPLEEANRTGGDSRAEEAHVEWLVALALVAATCAFNLIILRSDLSPAHNLNDSSFHLEMVRWADARFREGHFPLDGWFPWLSLGSSLFHHYQTLPHVVTAYLAYLFGSHDQGFYLWIQYLLLALWPIAVFVGARLLGWSVRAAAGAAVVAPLIVSTPSYGYEHTSYTWQGYGVYTQLWAMWLLPLAWGATWRAISTGRRYAVAALCIALAIATNFMTGYLALLSIGVLALVVSRPLVQRLTRGAVIGAGALLTAAWVLVPLVADRTWSAASVYYNGTIFKDSYGARKIFAWLFTGHLFDAGRFPVVTLLAAVGLVWCVLHWRRDGRARALLGLFVLSLLLYFGRPTLGFVINLLPGNGDLQLHRFIIGVHMAGILLAGVGVELIVGSCLKLMKSPRDLLGVVRHSAVPVVGLAVLVAALIPGWVNRASYDLRDRGFIAAQQLADRTDGADFDAVVAEAKSRNDGRIYVGLRGNWGANYKLGDVPAPAELANDDADGIGFTFRTVSSLSTDIEAGFDETNLAQYQMLNIRYIILPSDRQPSVPATLLDSRGRHRLYLVDTSGYFQVADLFGAVSADRADLAAATRAFRSSDLAMRNVYPAVAFAGAPAAVSTIASLPPAGADSPGSVVQAADIAQDGVFSATVRASRPAMVVLKASYDPRWTVTVDARPARPIMVAPSLVGVEVPAGTHGVVFRYAPYPDYGLLVLLGGLVLAGLTFVPWLSRRRQTSVDRTASLTSSASA